MTSFFKRLSQEASNAMADMYGSVCLGDDAGKSVTLTLVLDPPSNSGKMKSTTLSPLAQLGMTFLEINGRAYVQTVIPGSPAFQAGIMPQDAIQYAILFKPNLILEKTKKLQQRRRRWKQQNRKNKNSTNRNRRGRSNDTPDGTFDEYDEDSNDSNTNTKTEDDETLEDDDEEDTILADEDGFEYSENDDPPTIATKFALKQEASGVRIGYDALQELLVDALDPTTQSAFVSPSSRSSTNGRNSFSKWNGPPIPSTVSVCASGGSTSRLPSHHAYQYPAVKSVLSSSSLEQYNNPSISQRNRYPVVFVFRRTRQRKSSMHHIATPSFRLDDECDFASSLVKRLAPTADMEIPPPDTWEELVHDGTDWLLGNGSMLPPKQFKLGGGRGGYNSHSNGADNPGSGSICVGADHHSIPLDEFERERAKKLANLRSKMAAEAMQVDRTEDVEAATIRGMIQKAVGLAFVRASKVVLGVSIHAGSGVVIARLSDGTWSAPSAIGTWGLGLGLQFGLEVAEYIFILQTQESLDHFRAGGNFTIGGNIGAAVAGMGREAYGAASANGACGVGSAVNTTIMLNKDDEYNDNDSGQHRRASGVCGGGKSSGCDDGAGACGAAEIDANSNSIGGSAQGGHTSSVGIAPIVAYAKSQGLYIGVSLEGSRIFSRDDMNSRAYKFVCGRDVSANDILSGKVPTPPEAEDLYAALHAVEFTHEMSCLPRPPEVLRKDSPNAWYYDRSTLGKEITDSNYSSLGNAHHNDSSGNSFHGGNDLMSSATNGGKDPFNFLTTLNSRDAESCETFETQFKKFMYGGVSVQRLIPNSTNSRTGRTGRERRTLWLMLPEVGSLRLGFVSKLSDGENGNAVSNKSSTIRATTNEKTIRTTCGGNSIDGDLMTVESEEVTLDSALFTDKDNGSVFGGAGGQIRQGNVQLSNKHSVALTDLTILSQDPLVPIRFNPEDQTEHLRVISMQDVSGTSLLFLANNFREAELLVCGLKLLLERETIRLGVRGGLPITALGGRSLDGAMSPAAARGFRDRPPSNSSSNRNSSNYAYNNRSRTGSSDGKRSMGGYSSSEADEFANILDNSGSDYHPNQKLPEGRSSWGRVPGRSYMRGQAASTAENLGTNGNSSDSLNGNVRMEHGLPRYIHGQMLVRDVAKNIRLPIPLPLCRVLILDSTSPVNQKWEVDRGDLNYERSLWTFPPATPRELERHSSEHQLIATGSMCGAHRTLSFDRMRNGTLVRLSETQIIDADDSEKLAITVTERMPRRGFSIKIRLLLRAIKDNKSTEVTVFGEVRPVGRDMSNQAAVHKAFSLVLNEIKSRYGDSGKGLMACFLHVVENMGNGNDTNNNVSLSQQSSGAQGRTMATTNHNSTSIYQSGTTSRFPLTGSTSRLSSSMNEEKKSDYSPPSRPLNNARDHSSKGKGPRLVSLEDMLKTGRQSPELFPPPERPPTPSLQHRIPEPDQSKRITEITKNRELPGSKDFTQVPDLMEENDGNPIIPNTTKRNHNNNMSGAHDHRNISSTTPHHSNQKKVSNIVTPEKNVSNNVNTQGQDQNNESPEPVLIEVKPLPKIRLSLMPSPREEDEESDSDSYSPVSSTKKSISSSSKKKGRRGNSNRKSPSIGGKSFKRRPTSAWRKSSRQKS